MTKQLQDAYIVAATRTAVGKAPRGMFRNTRPDDTLAHVLRSVVAQAPGIDTGRIDDAIIGCAMPEGEQGHERGPHRRAAGRPAEHGGRADRQPLLFFRPAGGGADADQIRMGRRPDAGRRHRVDVAWCR